MESPLEPTEVLLAERAPPRHPCYGENTCHSLLPPSPEIEQRCCLVCSTGRASRFGVEDDSLIRSISEMLHTAAGSSPKGAPIHRDLVQSAVDLLVWLVSRGACDCRLAVENLLFRARCGRYVTAEQQLLAGAMHWLGLAMPCRGLDGCPKRGADLAWQAGPIQKRARAGAF